jgi:phenylacetate-CoA ligase
MSLINYLSENIILPASDLILSNKIRKYLTFLNESQYWSREQIAAYQNARLEVLINHAYKYVPYYHDLFAKLNLLPEDIRSKADLEKLPVLTKATIKKEGIERFTSSAFTKKKLILSSSSGSTGEPLFYYITKDAYSMNLASNLRGWYWMGFRLGDKFIKLSQNSRKNPVKRLQDKMSRNLYLATNPLIDSNFEHILNEIERYKPKFIRCYPDPLLFLTHYKYEHPRFSHKPIAINTTGNTLHPETRNEIETVFGCKIFDSYSCEGNSNVFECPSHTGYHSTEEYGISEILDETGKPITQGIGRLISTDLWDLAHPFIRYDTQDLVDFDSRPCICGRQHLKILRILGRDNEVLEMKTGRKFIVHNFTGFFQTDIPEINRSIEQFQVVKKESKVIFRLVVNRCFTEAVSDYIKDYWEKEMQTNVDVEIVENIPLTQSGKRKFIINE